MSFADSLLKEFSKDQFVVQLLKTIPDHVGSIEQLRSRFFNKLDKECRNLALFRRDDELSLGKYVVGYLQGSLITRCGTCFFKTAFDLSCLKLLPKPYFISA
jgi:hypothetical protein